MTFSGYLLDSGHIDHAIQFVYVQFRGNWLLARGHADRVGPFLFGATWVGQLEQLAPLQPRSALHARCTICACQPLEAQGGTLVRQSFRQVDDGQNFEAAQSQDHRQKLQTAPNKYRRDELAIQKGPEPDARHVLYALSTPPI